MHGVTDSPDDADAAWIEGSAVLRPKGATLRRSFWQPAPPPAPDPRHT